MSQGTPGEARIAHCWRAQGLSTEGPRRGSWASVPRTDLSPCLSLGSFEPAGATQQRKGPPWPPSTRTAGRCWAGLPRGAAPLAPDADTRRRPQGQGGRRPGARGSGQPAEEVFPSQGPRAEGSLTCCRRQAAHAHRPGPRRAEAEPVTATPPRGGGRDSATLQLEAGGSYTLRGGSCL